MSAGVGAGDRGFDVQGKGGVVTAAWRGIGRALATRMAAEGARVVVNDLNADNADGTTVGRVVHVA